MSRQRSSTQSAHESTSAQPSRRMKSSDGNNVLHEQLRMLPSVDALAQRLVEASQISHTQAVRIARETLDQARQTVKNQADVPLDVDALLAQSLRLLAEQRHLTLRPVINATGVIISTNLGRAPLSREAMQAMAAVAQTYSNLEYDTHSGERGSRQTPVHDLLCSLTGAEDALVVNNNAAALLVVLATIAPQREVIVSRGELVEIGGGFRIPEVLSQSGARLVEVGTTNRTRAQDYAAALSDDTAALLAVHPSNFRMIGFTEAPALQELAALAHAHSLPLIHDVGSGSLFATERWGLVHEPMPQESITAGADIVCFSGDKLLGGPQAGIIVGRAVFLSRIARHPLMRAVRSDKLTLSALEATLRLYRNGQAEQELPIWQAITMPLGTIRQRAEQWTKTLRSQGIAVSAVPAFSTIGGGSLPGETLPTVVCAIEQPGRAADALASKLRQGSPALITRISRDRLLLDPRTVRPDEDEMLLQLLWLALQEQ